MNRLLYITADKVGTETGGGKVAAQELQALQTLGTEPVIRISREELGDCQDPWGWDERACCFRDWFVLQPKLAHFYSGTFGQTVDRLKWNGCKIVYTIAAHDRDVSRQEHEKMGAGFPYIHLTNSNLWKRYIYGYQIADVIVCPSTVAARTVRAYGKEFENKRIEVIPHGVDLPPIESLKPHPNQFTVGYLGSYGFDKGVRYLLEAWKKLNYKNATLLLGGRDSTSPFVRQMIQTFGGGNIELVGWVDNTKDFYDRLSLYVQASASEGFGLEVLEAMACGRPVICSDGAGAQDVIPLGPEFKVHARNSNYIADAIDCSKTKRSNDLEAIGWIMRDAAENYTWDKIRDRYVQLWKELI